MGLEFLKLSTSDSISGVTSWGCTVWWHTCFGAVVKYCAGMKELVSIWESSSRIVYVLEKILESSFQNQIII